MNGRRAGSAAALGAAAAVLLAGCGVPTTGVVDVGVPADGLVTEPSTRSAAVAFFLDGERLEAAGLTVPGGSDPVTAAVDLLFAGPAAAGRPDLTTRLPQPPVTAHVTTQDRTVTVRLPAQVPQLDALAMRQLTCTVVVSFPSAEPVRLRPPVSGGAAAATADPRSAAARVRVEAIGPGWHLEQEDQTCPPVSLPSAFPTRPPS